MTKIEYFYEIQNPRNNAIWGFINSDLNNVIVPKSGALVDFLHTYNALQNPDMGQLVSILDNGKFKGFYLLYGFIWCPSNLNEKDESQTYSVQSLKVTNLDYLEILHQYGEKTDSVKRYI